MLAARRAGDDRRPPSATKTRRNGTAIMSGRFPPARLRRSPAPRLPELGAGREGLIPEVAAQRIAVHPHRLIGHLAADPQVTQPGNLRDRLAPTDAVKDVRLMPSVQPVLRDGN